MQKHQYIRNVHTKTIYWFSWQRQVHVYFWWIFFVATYFCFLLELWNFQIRIVILFGWFDSTINRFDEHMPLIRIILFKILEVGQKLTKALQFDNVNVQEWNAHYTIWWVKAMWCFRNSECRYTTQCMGTNVAKINTHHILYVRV